MMNNKDIVENIEQMIENNDIQIAGCSGEFMSKDGRIYDVEIKYTKRDSKDS